MSWQFLAIINVFFYASTVLLQRTVATSKNSDAKTTAVVFQLLTGAMVGLVGFLLGANFQLDLAGLWAPFLLVLVLYAVGNLLIFKSLENTEASLFSIIFSTRAAVTALVAYLFLGEVLSSRNLWGLLFVLGGVLIVNLKNTKKKSSSDIVIPLTIALIFGINNTVERALLQQLDLYGYVTIAFIIPALLLLFTYPSISVLKQKLTPYSQPKMIKNNLLMSALYAGSAVTFFTALQTAETASQVTTINISSVVLTVILAAIFLKERDHLNKKLVAAVLTLIGLYLVTH